MKKNQILWVGLMCCSLFLLSACLKHDEVTPSQPASYLYVIQASPDAPDMDIYLNDTALFSQPLVYPAYSNGYQRVHPGNYSFAFTGTGDTDPLTAANGSLEENNFYSLITYDSAAALKTMLIHDQSDNDDPSKAEIRFFQLSPNTTDSVDVYLDDEKVFSGRTFADNVDHPSLNDFVEIDGGSYTLLARSKASGDTLATFDVTLQAPVSYTLFLRGLAGRTDSSKLELDGVANVVNN